MISKLKTFEENSQTLKEARLNVKKRNIVLDIIIFIVTYILLLLSQLIPGLLLYGIIDKWGPIGDLIDLFSRFALIIALFFTVYFLEKRSLRSVGLSISDAIPSLLKGLLIGFIMFLAVVIIGFALGQFRYNGFDFSQSVYFIPYLLGFAVQSFSEEFHQRGWTMTYIAKRHRVIVALIISSICFSASHLFNLGIDTLSLINIFLVGILFALMFWKYDNIWVCGGAHTAWNFSQGVIFGFNVSGNATPSILKCSQAGQNIINGGLFGPESSLIATIVITAAIILILYLPKKS